MYKTGIVLFAVLMAGYFFFESGISRENPHIKREAELQKAIRKISVLQKQLKEIEVKLVLKKNEHAKTETKYKRKINRLEREIERIIWIWKPLVFPRNQPDGEIYFSDITNKYAYLDLGNQDGIKIGMRFEVFQFRRAGNRLYIGLVEVKRILSNHTCQTKVIELDNNDRPMLRGDKVMNQLFWKGKYRTISFAGKFGGKFTKYSREHAKKLLEEFGAKVVDKYDVSVDLLIVGKDYKNDPNYKKAKEFKVEIMSESELHYYLVYRK